MKKKYKVILCILILLIFSGCTKVLRDKENKPITYETTGQNITENILCRPTDEEVIKIYNDNDIDISKLPECVEFKINQGGYEGLWNSFFVRPLSWFIIKVGSIFGNYGLALIIVSIVIRLMMYPATKGTALQSERMKKAQPDLDIIEKKYKDKKNQEDTMKKSQEIMAVYKKNNINPLSGCLFAFLQLPIFFAFLEAINRTPAIFEGNFLFYQLGTTPFVAIQNGQYHYFILIILLVLLTHLSFKLNKTASMNSDSQKQMAFMSKIMLVFITIASFTLSTAISIYWISSSAFTILQNQIVKRSKIV